MRLGSRDPCPNSDRHQLPEPLILNYQGLHQIHQEEMQEDESLERIAVQRKGQEAKLGGRENQNCEGEGTFICEGGGSLATFEVAT